MLDVRVTRRSRHRDDISRYASLRATWELIMWQDGTRVVEVPPGFAAVGRPKRRRHVAEEADRLRVRDQLKGIAGVSDEPGPPPATVSVVSPGQGSTADADAQPSGRTSPQQGPSAQQVRIAGSVNRSLGQTERRFTETRPTYMGNLSRYIAHVFSHAFAGAGAILPFIGAPTTLTLAFAAVATGGAAATHPVGTRNILHNLNRVSGRALAFLTRRTGARHDDGLMAETMFDLRAAWRNLRHRDMTILAPEERHGIIDETATRVALDKTVDLDENFEPGEGDHTYLLMTEDQYAALKRAVEERQKLTDALRRHQRRINAINVRDSARTFWTRCTRFARDVCYAAGIPATIALAAGGSPGAALKFLLAVPVVSGATTAVTHWRLEKKTSASLRQLSNLTNEVRKIDWARQIQGLEIQRSLTSPQLPRVEVRQVEGPEKPRLAEHEARASAEAPEPLPEEPDSVYQQLVVKIGAQMEAARQKILKNDNHVRRILRRAGIDLSNMHSTEDRELTPIEMHARAQDVAAAVLMTRDPDNWPLARQILERQNVDEEVAIDLTTSDMSRVFPGDALERTTALFV